MENTCSKLFLVLTNIFLVLGCTNTNQLSTMNTTNVHAIRLKPGQDLKKSIQDFVVEKNIQAGWIISIAGSLTNYNIRFANVDSGTKGNGHFEILTLSGTLSVNGSHLHVSVSDSTGKCIGGHLLEGCLVYTTAEIIIGESKQLRFTRANDGTTPWQELQIDSQ